MRTDFKDTLVRYLQGARDAVLWKLDGLSEHDARRPLTPTGTNVLGLVKHLAYVEAGYFGDTFGRPFPDPLPAYAEGEDPNADLWATAEESREYVVDLYRSAWAHARETFAGTALDAVGTVPWWREGSSQVSLHTVLVHVTTETHRHAGHVDIVRELIDATAGLRESVDNLPGEGYDWAAHRARVEAAAATFRQA